MTTAVGQSNITHAASSVITIALKQLQETGTVTPYIQGILKQARDSLRSLCPRCVAEDQARNEP
jgi:hypothetical protein